MALPSADPFSRIDLPIWLVTAQSGARRSGLIATCVSQASIVPDLPRVLVGLARQHLTWELVEASRTFAVHLLGQDNFDWVERFGTHSGRDGADKFQGLRIDEEGPTGSPLLADALGWLACRVETALDGGDRTFYLAQVFGSSLLEVGEPLTTRGFLERAGPVLRRRLAEQLERDAAVDAPAIQAWRKAHGYCWLP